MPEIKHICQQAAMAVLIATADIEIYFKKLGPGFASTF